MQQVAPSFKNQYGSETDVIVSGILSAIELERSARVVERDGREYEADIMDSDATDFWIQISSLIGHSHRLMN